MRNVLVTALLVLASGCAGSGGAEQTSEAVDRTPTATAAGAGPTSEPYPGAGVGCPSAKPSPISVEEAVETLREHGFTVSEVEQSCGLQLIRAMLTNASSSPFAGTVMRRQGVLQCFVLTYVRPLAGAQSTVAGDTAAASADRRLGNLDCDLWGAQARGFDAHVRRLDRAFDALSRRLAR